MKTAVITTARGRHRHLQLQLLGLARCAPKHDAHIVVSMDDAAIGDVVAETGCDAQVVGFDTGSRAVPVATARNVGARAAIARGADLLIFLDVDCIPATEMVGGYRQAAADDEHRGALLCGTVSYLPPPPADGYDMNALSTLAQPHPFRPDPPAGKILESTDYQLFWSLSFATATSTWHRIGGFHTGYTGYGAEDTDFAQIAAAAAVQLRWVGGAQAFHQHHPVSDPPIEHLAEIVSNARLFHRRWGWWPMSGWLEAFAKRKLIYWDTTELRVLRSGTEVPPAYRSAGM